MSDVLGLQGIPGRPSELAGGCISVISYVGAETQQAQRTDQNEAAGGWCISVISYVAAEEQQAPQAAAPE